METRTTTVTTVTGFLQAISKLEVVGDRTRFFRGHSNAEKYLLEPGIYREIKEEKSLINHEDKIYRDVITQAPQDFEGKNTLESLALMQHYGVPTRILDITQNALVGLYFACNSNGGKQGSHGEVVVLDIPDESVCHYNSDRITVLANLAKGNKLSYSDGYFLNLVKIEEELDSMSILNKPNYRELSESDVKNIIQDDIEKMKLMVEIKDNQKYINWLNENNIKIENTISLFLSEITNDCFLVKKEFDNFLNIIEKLYKESFIEERYYKIGLFLLKKDVIFRLKLKISSCIKSEIELINEVYFGKFLHNVKEDKPYFLPIIDPRDLHSIYAVKPKLDNPRIIRQQGAFLVYGIVKVDIYEDVEVRCLTVEPNWFVKTKENEELKILVDKNAKKDILKELEILGISQSTLFPEIDKVADSVKKKYEGIL
ncbi:FRG domain-containing protein [Myroides odoratimimus]|uniref:FRG domain-containing protein n=1 Tax=Myroides odoratimimus TaxID=76832 RepID=UPI00091A59BE|nr:FRG domain-containing protein [Myroides odoratimimus]MEC4027099.1 FRG domain-containing protein [Myroides odoratimimus]MEC4053952.1 FRG domain-containing protein [Myroides odoratimimus]SHL91520.1 FRG domain-containing protein [Myroides odoratimimus subsp. xuanwuensis]